MNLIFIAGAAEKIKAWFSGWFGAVLSIIPKTMYFLCTLIFQILDILQILVRKVAGLDVVYYTSNIIEPSGPGANAAANVGAPGDIVYTFIQSILLGKNAILSNVFWALIILGVIMLFLTTLIAVLRSEYMGITDGKAASKTRIIGQAFKAIASFVIVPIVCFFGVFLANVILQALDTITTGSSYSQLGYEYTTSDSTTGKQNISSLFKTYQTTKGETTYITYNFWGTESTSGESRIATTSTPISGLIFKAAAYKANRIRFYQIFRDNLDNQNVGAKVFNNFGTDYDTASDLLDECFANGYSLKEEVDLDEGPFKDDYLFRFGNGSSFISNTGPTISSFDKNNVQAVWYYYDLWGFDFILCIAALVICAKLLIYLVFGLMKRIFELVALFLIAAPIASLMPLDDGAALKKWREKFLSKTIGAYGPIVGLNLFFIILPIITTIKFFNIPLIDSIVTMLFTIVGLIMVKDLVGTISELIGGENTLKSGSDMAQEVGSTVASVGKLAAAPAGLAVKGIKGGIKAGKAISNKYNAHKEQKQSLLGQRNKAGEMFDENQTLETRNKTLDSWISTVKKGLIGVLSPKKRARAEKNLRVLEREKAQNLEKIEENNTNLNRIGWSKETLDQFNSGNRQQQRVALRHARLNMSEEAKAGAAEYADSAEGQQRQKARRMAYRRANLAPAQRRRATAFDNAFKGNVNVSGYFGKNWAKMSTKEREDAISAYNDEAGNLMNNKGVVRFGHRGELNDGTHLNLRGKHLSKRIKTVTGKDATPQDLQTERRKHSILNSLPGAGLLKNGEMLNAGKTLAKSFLDNLTPMLKTLGGSMAKGFNEAGGWGGIGARIAGQSAKEEGAAQELKNQKKILAAQDKASDLLGRRSGGSGPSQMSLDDKSIQKLANAINAKK